jgi:hypothetical protein
MTSEAKSALAKTIRSLRARLLQDLHAATDATYRLSVRVQDAGLDEAGLARRARLVSWIAEQARTQGGGKANSKGSRTTDDFWREAEKQAAYTLLNRLVLLRLMEAPSRGGEPLRAPAVVTGGWESRAYKDFRELGPALVRGDDTEGYAFLLRLVFEDLASELPGLYGPAGVADLIPIPAATLRHVVEALDQPALESCWTDDMTLGWVYEYWNDPEREALDAKLNAGGKIEPHEIASKTQMFTERYMVDWLLQNSLGPMWLAMCKQHGWTPEVEGDGTLQRLEERRAEWRKKRDAGEVSLTELMPLYTDAERRWAYYVPQPLPDDAVEHAPKTVRDLKILDPAVGSGHFVVVATDLLVALYREEARHRSVKGQPEWSDRAIVERILSHNLHGIDLDPRAVQIAAAALWLKARQIAPDAELEMLNLVSSNLRLASLAADDPAFVELCREVERETAIPGELTNTIVHAMRGADHLGSLLKVDRALEEALDRHEAELGSLQPSQGDFFDGFPEPKRVPMRRDAARTTIVERLEEFLARHSGGDDLGLRLRGEQLAAGVRFVRLIREGSYDLVVANPPYQGTSRMTDTEYIESQYPLAKSDLYAAFLLRGLEMAREGGMSAMLTMRNWMFIKQYEKLRAHLLAKYDLRALGDFAIGAFAEVPNDVLTVAVSVFRRLVPNHCPFIAQQPTHFSAPAYDRERTARKIAAALVGAGIFEASAADLYVIQGHPLVYWWRSELIEMALSGRLLGTLGKLPIGLQTGNNDRFLRRPWEIQSCQLDTNRVFSPALNDQRPWKAYVKGAAGVRWFEPLSFVIWFPRNQHAAYATLDSARYGQGAAFYYSEGVAYNTKGVEFSARALRFASVFDVEGRALFGVPRCEALCLLNSRTAKYIVESLNPTIHFTAGDVARIPVTQISGAEKIFAELEAAFDAHESHREPSIEFRHPGPSPWRHAQEWAQIAVDRANAAHLPPYDLEFDPDPPTDRLSFALGVVLGRFGQNGEGILDPMADDLSAALPAGILFLDGSLEGEEMRDSLGNAAAALLQQAWTTYGLTIGTNRKSLREWLALDFFKDVHKGMYGNRPIHWPLSSANKTFVAWVNIHRFTEQTLRILLADYLHPALSRLEGELNDLRAARDGADKKAARMAEKQYDNVLRARDELQAFIADVEQCADRGAPPADAKTSPREQDARYAPDLNDGVMINSAALWPLLEPQWKDPKKWWKELSEAKGKKDYDWSHLAMRYWPSRVDEKCQNDPSLGVAHGCFWRYHSERAWAWELRLQEEIGPDCRIEEPPYRPGGRDVGDHGDGPHRDAWLCDYANKALDAVEKEAIRRIGRSKGRKLVPEMRILETGLWSRLPAEVWQMELRVAERQGTEFRLLAPDEPEARAAFEAKNPDKVRERAVFLANIEPLVELFGDPGEEDEGNIADDADEVDNEDAA